MLYPELRRFAGVVASSDVDPDDLVQEALAGVLRRGDLDSLEHPGAYLRQAILNVERDHRRRWARWRERAPHVRRPDQSQPSYPSDLSLLDLLEPFDRALLYLTVVEDLPYSVIAELLGKPEGALRARASKARRLLRKRMEEEDHR